MCIRVQKKNQKQISKSYFVMQHYNETFLKLIIDFKLCSKKNFKDISHKFLYIKIFRYLYPSQCESFRTNQKNTFSMSFDDKGSKSI